MENINEHLTVSRMCVQNENNNNNNNKINAYIVFLSIDHLFVIFPP